MKMFPCPSPKGTNHAGLFLNERGDLVDRNGNLWGKSGTMAMDSLPRDLSVQRELATKAARKEIKKLARERVRRLARDTMHDLPFGGDLVRQKDCPEAFDAEARLEMLRHYLRGRGLSDADVEEAIEHARRDLAARGEAVDTIPANALHGGFGEAISQKSRDEFERKHPEAARVEVESYGPERDRFDERIHPQSRDRRQQAHDAATTARSAARMHALGVDRVLTTLGRM